MGQRSRKRRRGGGPATSTAAAPPRQSRYERSAARDAEVRARLEPLAPGERPRAVTIGAILAALLGVANLGLFALGVEVDGGKPAAGGVLVLAGLLLATAVGMWRSRYWAVLGLEVLLGVTLVFAAVSLLVAANVRAALLSLAVIAVAGALFWSLIRAMARIQMPERSRREPPA